MKKILFITIAAACFYSCKKESKTTTTTTNVNASLLIGKWQATTERLRASTTDGKQALDTTFDLVQNFGSWYEIYNSNGTAYVTVGANDTSSRLGYAVSGNTLTVYDGGDKGDKSFPEYSTILKLTNTSMEQESKYTETPESGFGLNENTVYNFTEDVTYSKQ